MRYDLSPCMLAQIRSDLERFYRRKVRESDLDDFISDVLLGLVTSRSYDAARCGGDPRRYAAGIARRMLCQYYKSLRRQSSLHFIAYEELEETDASMDVVEELVAERQARAFLTQLARLSLRDRRVIELLQSGVQGKDVAHQMGLSASAVYQVRSRFARAVRAEDVRLQDQDSEGGGP